MCIINGVSVPGAWVSSYEVAELPQNVAPHLHHVLMARWSLQRLQSHTK